jgi:hypothetical protein
VALTEICRPWAKFDRAARMTDLGLESAGSQAYSLTGKGAVESGTDPCRLRNVVDLSALLRSRAATLANLKRLRQHFNLLSWNPSMRSFILTALIAVAGLSGCSFGKAYIAPAPEEPSARIVVKDGYFEVIVMDEKGCYSGFVSLHGDAAETGTETGFRVHADRRLVMHHDSTKSGGLFSTRKVCRVEFYFTPKKDAKYTPVPGYLRQKNEKSSQLMKALSGDEEDVCTVDMIEVTADGAQSWMQLTKTRPMQKSFNCIRF